jgi:hypothetical protein
LNFCPPGSRFATAYAPGEGLDRLCFRVRDLVGMLDTLRAEGFRPTDLLAEVADGE